MFLNDEVMKKADCMRITFHTVGLLYCFYIIFILLSLQLQSLNGAISSGDAHDIEAVVQRREANLHVRRSVAQALHYLLTLSVIHRPLFYCLTTRYLSHAILEGQLGSRRVLHAVYARGYWRNAQVVNAERDVTALLGIAVEAYIVDARGGDGEVFVAYLFPSALHRLVTKHDLVIVAVELRVKVAEFFVVVAQHHSPAPLGRCRALAIIRKVIFTNSSLKFDIKAKQFYAASQRVL